jgi:hypothetical protein
VLRGHAGRPRTAAIAALALAAGAIVSGAGVGRFATGLRDEADAATTGRHLAAAARAHLAATRAPSPPALVVTAAGHATSSWKVVARFRAQPAAWLARRSGVTLMRFDQGLVHLTLHAGSSDGGVKGWTFGDRVSAQELPLLVAAFNGGFKLTYRDVGFMSGGHVAVALKAGLASIVTYSDGTSDVGAWRAGVPSAGKKVFSVLQNQRLLVNRGVAAASVSSCIIACWGETVGGRTAVARSGLGITANGELVWAAGEQLRPANLAAALIAAGAARAIELDINPDWVAGYLYPHHRTGPFPVPVVPGQLGIGGKLLEPYSRDFLTVVAN